MKRLSSALFPALLLCWGAAASACTSWVIMPDRSASGRMLLHKSRDQHISPLTALIQVTNGVRWMNIGASRQAMFTLTERGVGMTSNSGDTNLGRHRKPPKGLRKLADSLTAEGKDAETAAEIVRDYGRAGGRSKGGMYLVADAKRAFAVEIASNYGEMMEIPGGIYVISNSMHLGGCEGFMYRPPSTFRSHRAREANTRAELQKNQIAGKYTVAGVLKTSRLTGGSTPFNKYSLSAVCFEFDAEFPAFVTCAYIALGPQQHTVYLPTPMALTQFPEDMQNGKWAARALALRMKVGDDHEYLGRIEALEKQFLAEFDRVRTEALALLRSGRRDEAKKLLNDTFLDHYTRAKELLRRIAEEAGVDPDPPVLAGKKDDERLHKCIMERNEERMKQKRK